MKKLLCALVCLCLILPFLPKVEAAETDSAAAAILEAYEQHLQSVDMEQYNLNYDQLDEIFTGLRYSGQLPWYAHTYQYKYQEEDGKVVEFTPVNLSTWEYDYDLYERTVAEILAQTVHEGMSDWQIALSIHDYLAANASYDQSENKYGTCYDLLVRGTAVCAGYAMAYMDLMNRAGVPCRYVTSEEMNHGWNVVQIGGSWYHVDVTWDDPTPDTTGLVSHNFFLISDEAIAADEENPHYNWASDVECSDTSLDENRFWHDINSQICFDGEGKCYFRYENDETVTTIYSRGLSSGDETPLVTFDPGYIDIGGKEGYEYSYDTYGLSLYNGRLYYGHMTQVLSCLPDGSDEQVVYSHDYASTKNYILGAYVSDGILYLELSTHDGETTTMQMDLGLEKHEHSYIPQVVEPGCISHGYTVWTCDCGVSYETDWTAALGHGYDEGTVVWEASASSAGLRRFTCRECGDEYEEEIPYIGSSDSGMVTEEEYTIRRILLGGGILAVIVLVIVKKKKKKN